VTALRPRFLTLHALRWLPNGLIAPLFVLIMASRGLDLAEIGVVLVPFGVTVVLLELPTGGLADALGRRPVLALAAAFDLAFYAIFLFAREPWQFFTSSLLYGIGRALDSGPLEAWYVDAARTQDPEADLRPALARAGVVEGLALAVGSVLGGLLPVVFDLRAPIVAAALLVGVRLAGVLLGVREVRAPAGRGMLVSGLRRAGATVREALALAGRAPNLRRLLALSAVLGFGLLAVEVLWQPHFRDLLGGVEGNTPVFGGLLAGAFVAAAVGSGLAPFLLRAVGGRERIACILAVLGIAASIGTLSAAGHIAALTAAFLAFYGCHGLIAPLVRALLHAEVGPAHRSTMLSADSLALQSGGVAMKLGLAPLAASAGVPIAWALTAALIATAGTLLVRALTGPVGSDVCAVAAGVGVAEAP
jgi:MFS family permease